MRDGFEQDEVSSSFHGNTTTLSGKSPFHLKLPFFLKFRCTKKSNCGVGQICLSSVRFSTGRNEMETLSPITIWAAFDSVTQQHWA